MSNITTKRTTKPKRINALDVILSETVIFGGELMMRREVRATMMSEGHDARCIDYFTFHSAKVNVVALEDDKVA